MKNGRFWFPEWKVLCTLNNNVYSVCNGGWSFTLDEEGYRYYEYTKDKVCNVKDVPLKVTKKKLRKIAPNFNVEYW